MSFKIKEKDLGRIKEKTKHYIEFYFTPKENIVSINPSCNCTSYTFKKNRLTLKYNSGEIPFHLSHLKELEQSISVDVVYDNGDIDKLTVKMIVYK